MDVYFDNCALQRPLDDQSSQRVRLEGEAVLGLVELIEAGRLQLVASGLVESELMRTPDPERIVFGQKILQLAERWVTLTLDHRIAARRFHGHGLKPLDAAHLAVAHLGRIEYLCTCDDRFLKAARRIPDLNCTVILPTELLAVADV